VKPSHWCQKNVMCHRLHCLIRVFLDPQYNHLEMMGGRLIGAPLLNAPTCESEIGCLPPVHLLLTLNSQLSIYFLISDLYRPILLAVIRWCLQRSAPKVTIRAPLSVTTMWCIVLVNKSYYQAWHYGDDQFSFTVTTECVNTLVYFFSGTIGAAQYTDTR